MRNFFGEKKTFFFSEGEIIELRIHLMADFMLSLFLYYKNVNVSIFPSYDIPFSFYHFSFLQKIRLSHLNALLTFFFVSYVI